MQPRPIVQKAPPGQTGQRLAARTTPARRHDLAPAPRPQLPDNRRTISGLGQTTGEPYPVWDCTFRRWSSRDCTVSRQCRMPRADCQCSDRAQRECLMAARFQLVIDCREPEPLARFWAAALGYEFEPPPEGFATWDDYWRDVGVSDEDLGIGQDCIVDPDGDAPPHLVPGSTRAEGWKESAAPRHLHRRRTRVSAGNAAPASRCPGRAPGRARSLIRSCA